MTLCKRTERFGSCFAPWSAPAAPAHTSECTRTSLYILCAAFALLAVAGQQAFAASPGPVPVPNFGTNPGNLKMYKYIPDRIAADRAGAAAPLVVVMHGCTQNGPSYAKESGWISVADRLNLILVIPEQQNANQPMNCFKWYNHSDETRGQGEALSIKSMVDQIRTERNIDPKRIFVTGLSAGGAMASVMLATYPDVFSGGGIVAGLPYGCADNQVEATSCMSTGRPTGGPVIAMPGMGGAVAGAGGMAPGEPFGQLLNLPVPPGVCFFYPLSPTCRESTNQASIDWGAKVRQASTHNGPWPKVSIWHGSVDTTVTPVDAEEEKLQWLSVHGIDPKDPKAVSQDTVNGYPHQTFKDASGMPVVETYTITGMGHGQPIDPGVGGEHCGTPSQYVLDANICAASAIAKFWGLEATTGSTGD